MRVEAIPCLADNYAYLVIGGTGSAVVVDPSEAGPVAAAAERAGVSLAAIWLTHHHHDHVGGVPELLARNPRIVVHASAYDAERTRIVGVTRALSMGDLLWFGSRRARVLEVPGHTLGALAYLVDGALFSGDTLFSGGCGRLFEGTPEQMQGSLDVLRSLPPETALYPGHEYTVRNLEFALHLEPENHDIVARLARARALRSQALPTVPSTLAEELATNPFLRWDAPAVIEAARVLGAANDEPAQVFAALRRAKDSY